MMQPFYKTLDYENALAKVYLKRRPTGESPFQRLVVTIAPLDAIASAPMAFTCASCHQERYNPSSGNVCALCAAKREE